MVAPENPENTAGPWRVYDPATRRDVTADALASLAAKFPEEKPGPGPMRGFVIPPTDE